MTDQDRIADASMRAMTYDRFGGNEVLSETRQPRPGWGRARSSYECAAPRSIPSTGRSWRVGSRT